MAGKEKKNKRDAKKDAEPTAAKAAPAKPSVAAHPKAARRVRHAREAAGLGGFLIGMWLSMGTHTATGAILRALIAGAACYVVVWGAGVLLCRHLIVAEIRSREHALMQAAQARIAALTGGEIEPGGGPPGAGAGR